MRKAPRANSEDIFFAEAVDSWFSSVFIFWKKRAFQGPKMSPDKNVQLDEAIYLWFVQMRHIGEIVTGPMLRKKAMEFNQKLNGVPSFKGFKVSQNCDFGKVARFPSIFLGVVCNVICCCLCGIILLLYFLVFLKIYLCSIYYVFMLKVWFIICISIDKLK